ncbi:MAG: hypothetical protein LBS26_03120 [Campylobacteraceae bacterium]|jgi:hypothetical protein|nr:hypothetical protein [Campylobacteraceae bacterium]
MTIEGVDTRIPRKYRFLQKVFARMGMAEEVVYLNIRLGQKINATLIQTR